MATREFLGSAGDELAANGVLAINAGRTASDYRLVDALSGTLTAVYPSVFVVDVEAYTNSVIFATNTETSVEEFRARALANQNLPLDPIVHDALATRPVRPPHTT